MDAHAGPAGCKDPMAHAVQYSTPPLEHFTLHTLPASSSAIGRIIVTASHGAEVGHSDVLDWARLSQRGYGGLDLPRTMWTVEDVLFAAWITYGH